MMLTSWIFLINSICVLSFSYPRRIVQKSVVIGPIAMSANDHWNLFVFNISLDLRCSEMDYILGVKWL